MTDHFFKSGKSQIHRLQRGDTVPAIEALPPNTDGVYVRQLDDNKAVALQHLQQLTAVYQDGASRLTDVGLTALATMATLQALDLTGSHDITDRGLAALHRLGQLEWVDLTGCTGLSPAAVTDLQRALPRCEIEPRTTTN